MATKLIITESQFSRVEKRLLTESLFQEVMIEKILKDLNNNYEPMLGIIRKDGEYHEEPMVKIKVDDTETSVGDLFKYLKSKYDVGDIFLKQVISDWMFGRMKDNKLSKNVAIN